MLFSTLVSFAFFPGSAQNVIIRGVVKDVHSDERIPFASLEFVKSHSGKLTDSVGTFAFGLDKWPNDTLMVTYVGYQDYYLPIDSMLISKAVNNVLEVTILLERGKYASEVVVKRTIDRGWLMWRRIVRRKPFNDRYRFNNFSYELYNKLELDIKNINKEKWQEMKLLKNFKFIFDNVDTSEGKPILPIYLTESISDYYFQKDPLKRREVFKASKTIGMNNESVGKLLGGMDQNLNFYSNFLPVFDKNFVSPISDNGDNYYKYRVLDSQFVAGRRLIHMTFTPKRKGQNTFEGDFWIHDSTFAVQKMNLRLSKEANINFIDQLSLIQEYKLINDSTWFLSKDKFVVDISPLGGSKLAFIGRKTTTYRDVITNDTSVVNELAKNRIMEETIMPDHAREKPQEYWDTTRHEDLSKTEAGIYKMIDTLVKLPAFQRAKETVYFLAVGYKNIGNFEIGPWYNWVSYNSLEGLRTRFDLGTNRYFSKQWFLHAYAAYGFTDKRWKYKMDAMYLINKNPRQYITASYKKDIDFGQTYYDEISQDNIFALAIRKSGVPIKFLMINEKRLEYYYQTHSGFSALVTGIHKEFEPLRNLPSLDIYDAPKDGILQTTEVGIRLRYAFLEKYLESTFNRISLGSDYPIPEIKYFKGISGMFGSRYNYHKLSAGVSHYKKVPPFGSIYYNVFAGKTFGKLPYMLLDIAPGNEIYYYNKYAFNLMNRYEFVHDKYAGVNFEHNIGNGIFRFIPLMKKLKFRQFYSARALWGGLSAENRDYNTPPGGVFPFQSLNGNTYLEVGTGVDNILKLFRVDFVWRILPSPLPPEKSKRFGIFGSFRLAF
ncbi:MAG: carboxypeptidase-like regulatory domain-containing protein [Chitinophagaceae bacterium]|nr:carboxypeptidase-like regulatory domain-containing protein [Chitinophagaceae bacterium]